MNKLKYLFFLILFLFFPGFIYANDLAKQLAGKILLQVEQNGEAWYVSVNNLKRYFLGRPDDAFSIMREQGIGISDFDLAKIPVSLDYLSGEDSSGDGLPDAFKEAMGLDINSIDSDGDGYDDFTELKQGFNPLGPGKLNYDFEFAARQAGKIFLQVEKNGEAWYVNPDNYKRYFLGRPHDAFSIMRNLGLGITDSDLERIEKMKETESFVQIFNWHFNQNNYSLEHEFSTEVFEIYNQDEKLLHYKKDNEPEDFREAYYEIFFEINEKDNDTLAVLESLRTLANKEGLSDDEKIEFILSFIQYIPYDYEKASKELPKANFPFETLYLNKGVCTDTSFLAILWLNELDYSTAILDFPDSNHAALGIKCPLEFSLNETGFCYIETTNYFPFGIVPSSIQSGQAKVDESLINNPFSSENLGKKEIRLKSDGRSYEKMETIIEKIESLEAMRQQIEAYKLELEKDLDNRFEIIESYNNLVNQYNFELKLFYHLN